MGASLLEMVLAIALTGMIFAAALLPTSQSLVDYQKSELDLRNLSAHGMATVRFEQVAGGIWRDPNGPPGAATLQAASANQLQTSYWELTASAGTWRQRYQAGAAATLLPAVSAFTYQYLLNTGAWTASPTAAQRSSIVAIRCTWTDPVSGLPLGSLAVLPDHRFSAGLLVLPQPDMSQAYSRDNYRRNLAFALGAWP
jgi:hypothetical protein